MSSAFVVPVGANDEDEDDNREAHEPSRMAPGGSVSGARAHGRRLAVRQLPARPPPDPAGRHAAASLPVGLRPRAGLHPKSREFGKWAGRRTEWLRLGRFAVRLK